jgi:hypothetical protein
LRLTVRFVALSVIVAGAVVDVVEEVVVDVDDVVVVDGGGLDRKGPTTS